MQNHKFYPVINKLISEESVPEIIRSNYSTLSRKIFYKSYFSDKSKDGDTANHNITLVFKGELGFNLFEGEEGFEFLINPGTSDNTTELPVSLYYHLPILKYTSKITPAQLSNPADYLKLLLAITGINKEQIFLQTLYELLNGDFQAFVDHFNNNEIYSSSTPLSNDFFGNDDEIATQIINELEGNGVNVFQYILDEHISVENDISQSFSNLFNVFKSLVGTINVEDLLRLFIPIFSVSIQEVRLALAFPRKWLQPVDESGAVITNENTKSLLTYNAGSIDYHSVKGLEFNAVDSFSLTRSQIGNTGILIEFDGLKLDLRNDKNIPEAISDGRPENFKGVYAAHAAVTLPEKWFKDQEGTTAQVVGSNFLIGTGGLSGTIALQAINPDEPNPKLTKKIGNNGFEVSFKSFDITFKQGKVVSSNILGQLKIPKLKDATGKDAEIDIAGHLNDEGDFLLTASEKDGFAPLNFFEFFDLYIQSLSLGSEDGKFFLQTSAQVAITSPVIEKLFCDTEQRIPLPNLRIYEDGSFEVVGGTIAVPSSFKLCLGPVEMSVTGINQGSYQQEHMGETRKYNFWGFDGAIGINPLGVDIRGEGVKFFYTVDNETEDADGNVTTREKHSFIRIKTIGIDMIIPGGVKPEKATAIIEGYLSIPQPGESKEYAGGISLSLPKAGLTLSGEMRLSPKHPAFIVDASVELPSPVPIGATGLAFSGIRGLLGYRYVAEKEAIGLKSGEDTWYDYYVYPKRGISEAKFSGPERTTAYKNPVAFGAGATISTVKEGILSVRAMFLLSIPSMFIMDGRGSILAPKYGLDDTGEPPFFAFLAVGDSSIEIGMGADLKIPQESGMILKARADIQMAFFFKNPKAWYINFGTKEQPVEGDLLDGLLTAKAFLQISARGIEAGARAEFNFKKKFGPVKVKAWLFVEVGGKISFEKPQIGAYLEAGGGVEASFWVVSVGISFYAIFSVEAPQPFLIYAELKVCGKAKIGFIKVKKCVRVKIKWEKSKKLDPVPIRPLAIEQKEEAVKAVNMLTGEAFPLKAFETETDAIASYNDAPVLPLDSFIDIKLDKAVIPSVDLEIIGGVNNPPEDYVELIPPVKTVKGGKTLRQEKHSYSVTDVKLEAWNGSSWLPYRPYESVTAKESEDANTAIEPFRERLGHWQKDRKEYSKIRLLANNPFSFTQQGAQGSFTPEELGISNSTIFCEGQKKTGKTINFLNRRPGTKFYVPFQDFDHYFSQGDLYLQVQGNSFRDFTDRSSLEFATVAKSYSNFDFARSLKFENTNSIAIKFPAGVREITLKMSSTAQGVHFRLYKLVNAETDGEINPSAFTDQLITDGEIYKTSTALYQEVTLTSETPIDKLIIDPETANEELIDSLKEQIAALFEDSYNNSLTDGESELVILEPSDKDAFDLLTSKLEEAKREGCNLSFPPARGIGAMQITNTFIVGVDAFLGNPADGPAPINMEEKCATYLHEISWLSIEDYEYNELIPGIGAIAEDFEKTIDSVSKVADPILRPETTYRLSFKLADQVDGGSLHEFQDYHYGFRTGKPLGFYHKGEGVTYGDKLVAGEVVKDSLLNPDKYPLTSLRNYIDYQRSYPNADGNLLNSKPLFYGTEGGNNEIKMFFTKSYIYHMFDSWGAYNGLPAPDAGMEIIIKDPIEKVTFSNPPQTVEEIAEIPGGTQSWSNDPKEGELEDQEAIAEYLKGFPEHYQQYTNLIENVPSDERCIVIPGDTIIPKRFSRTITINNLKPEKMYTAIVNARYESERTEIHNFVFKTSRYKSFEEQVNSYQLGDNTHAVFEVPVTTDESAIFSAFSVLNGTPDEFSKSKEIAYGDLFERVVTGILQLPVLSPAETTEFNVLKNERDETVGLLIRNPEPFNDPRIPVETLNNLKAFKVNAMPADMPNYKVLYAKDLAQILVMKKEGRSIRITEEAIDLEFNYLRWDGNQYKTQGPAININQLKIN